MKSSWLQIIGVTLLVAAGISRPLIFFSRPHADRTIVKNGIWLATSPLPVVFDRPTFFSYPIIRPYTANGPSVPIELLKFLYDRPWSSWGIVYAHYFFRISADGSPMRERDLLLGAKLFCDPSFYGSGTTRINAVTLEQRYRAPQKFPDRKVEIPCPQI